jgi:hypothetical protein
VIARMQCAIKLAAGNDVESCPELAQKLKHGNTGVCFGTIVESRVDRPQSVFETRILAPNNRRAINEARRAGLLGDRRKGYTLASQTVLVPHETLIARRVRARCASWREIPRCQYAFAHRASTVEGFPHLRQVFGGSADLNSSSGSTRIVAFVSSLIAASHCTSPHQPA